MSDGLIIRHREPAHECLPPDPDRFGVGTVWRCECGRLWIRNVNYAENRYTGAAWRRKLLPWVWRRGHDMSHEDL